MWLYLNPLCHFPCNLSLWYFCLAFVSKTIWQSRHLKVAGCCSSSRVTGPLSSGCCCSLSPGERLWTVFRWSSSWAELGNETCSQHSQIYLTNSWLVNLDQVFGPFQGLVVTKDYEVLKSIQRGSNYRVFKHHNIQKLLSRFSTAFSVMWLKLQKRPNSAQVCYI